MHQPCEWCGAHRCALMLNACCLIEYTQETLAITKIKIIGILKTIVRILKIL